jgi:DNA polymerase kappa
MDFSICATSQVFGTRAFVFQAIGYSKMSPCLNKTRIRPKGLVATHTSRVQARLQTSVRYPASGKKTLVSGAPYLLRSSLAKRWLGATALENFGAIIRTGSLKLASRPHGHTPDPMQPQQNAAREDPVDRPSCVPLGIQFNVHKAGLGNLQDADKIARTVAEAAKGGRFYENETRKEARLVAHVEAVRMHAITAPMHSAAADAAVAQVEAERPSSCRARIIVCVDFDCFFSAVEALDNPALRGKPHAVGGGKNSVLSTSSYEARAFGVRSAMPRFVALKLCPQLIVVPSRFHRYKEISKQVAAEVFAAFDPNFEMSSLDEALLDITDYVEASSASAHQVVEDLRARVKSLTGGLTASCGIASSRMLAKIGADVNKPDGQFMAPTDRDGVVHFMKSLPVRKIPGIGKVMERVLSDAFDVKTVGQILERRAALHHVLSPKTFTFLIRAALGVSSTSVDSASGGPRKGMSRERTFRAVRDPETLKGIINEICERLAADLVATEGRILGGRTVSIKLKQRDFRLRIRSRRLQDIVGRDSAVLAREAWTLVEKELPIEARLLGVRLTDLVGSEIDKAIDAENDQTKIERFFGAGCARASDDFEDDPFQPCPPAAQRHVEQTSRGPLNEIDQTAQIWEQRNKRPVHDTITPRVDDSRMTCPVCHTCSYSDLVLLNRHIDVCLNVQSNDWKRATLEFEREHAPSNPSKRQKLASIESYLTKSMDMP